MTFGRPASESSPVPPHAAAKAQMRSPTKRVAARRGRAQLAVGEAFQEAVALDAVVVGEAMLGELGGDAGVAQAHEKLEGSFGFLSNG